MKTLVGTLFYKYNILNVDTARKIENRKPNCSQTRLGAKSRGNSKVRQSLSPCVYIES